MAGVANTQKVFNFSIEIDGIDEFLIQEVKLPEVEVGVVEHGGTNYNIKTAGGVAVAAAELKKVKPVAEVENGAWDWLTQAQNMQTGTGSLNYKRNVIFKELSPTGAILSAWMWEGAWCSKVSSTEFKRGKQDEAVIETVTVQVDKIKKLV